MTPETVLEARGLEVAYGTTAAVQGFDLSIRKGEVIGLTGEAGCGKSTAAYALMGLVRPPGRITGGSVTAAGRDLLRLNESELRAIRGKDIGLIVQNPRAALSPMLKVGRQIGNVWLAHNDGDRRAARAKAVEMLSMVGINDPERRVDAFAHELSGGMAQRALIAMALSSAPPLLIADEPTSGLDVTIQAQFLDQMWATVQRTGSAILLVTQELGIVANYCDRVVVMERGRIVEDAPVRAFFKGPRSIYGRSLIAAEAERPPESGSVEGPVLIEVDGLTKRFAIRHSAKTIQAVADVDLVVREGETVGLVGESGSGKTTVGRCVLRLLEPTAGRMLWRGRPLAELAAGELRRARGKLQVVFQDPYDSLNPRWTVGRSLREPLDLHTSLSGTGKAARIEELLRLVGLGPEVAERKPRDLGSGALQRVNVARALATGPEFVVLDEPTSVLAPAARAGLIELLRRLQRELGLAFLFISHDLTTVGRLCHRVAVMYLSQIVETGPTAAVFADPKHPYAKALLASHLFPDPERRRVDRTDLERLEGEIPSPIDLPKGCYLQSRCPHAIQACAELPQALGRVAEGRLVRCHRVLAGELEREVVPA